jgi:hypothetical protein
MQRTKLRSPENNGQFGSGREASVEAGGIQGSAGGQHLENFSEAKK